MVSLAFAEESALCFQRPNILPDVWTFVDPREENRRFAAAKAGPDKQNRKSCISLNKVN